MFALKLAARSPSPRPSDPAAMLNEESRLELQEAQLQAHLAELDRREEQTRRAFEDRRVQVNALLRQGANLQPARLEVLPAGALAFEQPSRDVERALAARRAAIEARHEALDAERGRAERREQALAKAEQALAEIDRDLERERGLALRRAEEARRAERPRGAPALPATPEARPLLPPAAPHGAERRQHRRAALETHVDLVSDSNFYSGFSSDLSDGGIFVATCNTVPPGTVVDLVFTLPSGPSITARGVVRWSREPNDATPEVFPGLGVEFTEMSEEHRRAIREFTAQRDPLFWCE